MVWGLANHTQFLSSKEAYLIRCNNLPFHYLQTKIADELTCLLTFLQKTTTFWSSPAWHPPSRSERVISSLPGSLCYEDMHLNIRAGDSWFSQSTSFWLVWCQKLNSGLIEMNSAPGWGFWTQLVVWVPLCFIPEIRRPHPTEGCAVGEWLKHSSLALNLPYSRQLVCSIFL